MKTKVLYHRSCNDGFAAAYCAWTVLGDSAEYIAVSYGEDPPTINEGDRIYVVDFSYPREVMVSWEKIASTLLAKNAVSPALSPGGDTGEPQVSTPHHLSVGI